MLSARRLTAHHVSWRAGYGELPRLRAGLPHHPPHPPQRPQVSKPVSQRTTSRHHPCHRLDRRTGLPPPGPSLCSNFSLLLTTTFIPFCFPALSSARFNPRSLTSWLSLTEAVNSLLLLYLDHCPPFIDETGSALALEARLKQADDPCSLAPFLTTFIGYRLSPPAHRLRACLAKTPLGTL